jgi:hypothetical protein
VDWVYMARLAGYVCLAELRDGNISPRSPTSEAERSEFSSQESSSESESHELTRDDSEGNVFSLGGGSQAPVDRDPPIIGDPSAPAVEP